MLARNFMTAQDLGLSDQERDALIKTLVLMETGKMHYHNPGRPLAYSLIQGYQMDFTGHFNMGYWGNEDTLECGTVACIGGTAQMVGDCQTIYNTAKKNKALHDLFYVWTKNGEMHHEELREITLEQATRALNNYLTTGDADWDSVLVLGEK